MNKLGWILFMVVIVAGVLWWKKSKYTLVALAPERCIVSVDDRWSKKFQSSVVDTICAWYQEYKNPADVIAKVTEHFPEISTVQAQVCSIDKICFHLQAAQPIALLNKTHVLTVDGAATPCADFDGEVQQSLPQVTIDDSVSKTSLVRFIEQLSPDIASSHAIDWRNAYDIGLHPSALSNIQCVVSCDRIPTVDDIFVCQNLYKNYIALQPKRKNKQYSMVYDLRFKNQIIVRSGG